MNPDEIAKRVGDLKLTTEAKQRTITLSTTEASQGQQRANKLILGKIFEDRQHNREIIRAKLPSLLQIRGAVDIEMVGSNIFVLNLDLEADRDRFLKEGPWHFFNDLMLLQKMDTMQTVGTIVFDEISIWVQLHNIPIACMEHHIVRRIGEQIRRVTEIDTGDGGLCFGRYARVQVTRSIKEPLVRCIPIVAEGTTEENLILALYEKLPDHFCYACGRLGHHLRHCDASEDVKANPPFENWLKARRGIDYRRTATNT